MADKDTSKPTFAVLGTGALGGYYGACLHRAGYEVHFLCHTDGPHIREHGLRVESEGRWAETLRVPAYDDARDMPAVDVAMVTLKTTDNHVLPTILPPVMKSNGVALVLQNGLGVEEQVAEIVGADRVIGGLCFLCSNKIGPGHIKHLDYGKLVFAEFTADGTPGGITPRLERAATVFADAGLPIETTDHLRRARWMKLVWNIPYNGLSVILQATTDRIMNTPATRELAQQLMREVLDLAEADGCRIPVAFIDDMMRATDRMEPYKTSMMLDHKRGRPLEIESMYSLPLTVGRTRGMAAPRIEALEKLLQYLATNTRRSGDK